MRKSRFRNALSALTGIRVGARFGEPCVRAPLSRVVSLVNGRDGVGKTTLANNLAVYARTVDTGLPVLVVGLGERVGPDDMFGWDDSPAQETVDAALRRGSFESAIHTGRYGVHYVPSGAGAGRLEGRMLPESLVARALARTAFPGLVLLDTASDLGSLTRSAIAASDLCLVPVADAPSLESASRVFELFDELGWPRSRARVVLSMLDLRIKYPGNLCSDVLGLLVAETRRLGLPLCQSFIARSPRVQALATNPERQTLSILNEASRTSAHHQMGELAEELLEVLEALRGATPGDGAGIAARADGAGPEPRVRLRPRTPEAAMAVQRDGEEPFAIRRFPFFIGREDPAVLNDLAIPDLRPWQVSRRHAHFIQREGRIGVMDLGSTLGTWVDGHQLGSPTADPGPVFFRRGSGELILGTRQSPYAFDVAISAASAALPRETTAPIPLHAPAPAALAS